MSRATRQILSALAFVLAAAALVPIRATALVCPISKNQCEKIVWLRGDNACEPIPKPAGTSCNSGAGECNGDGYCVPITVTKVNLPWVVVAVSYAVPGNASSFTYGAGVTVGSRWRTYASAAGSTEKTLTFDRLKTAASGSFSVAAVTGQSGAVYGQAQALVAVKSPIDFDPLHRNDDFFLWVNPAIVVSSHWDGSRTYAWDVSTAYDPACGTYGMKIERFPAGMFDGSILPGTGCQQAFLAALPTADRQAILAHDPFWAGTNLATSPRFAAWPSPGSVFQFGSACPFCNDYVLNLSVAKDTCGAQGAGSFTDASAEVIKERGITAGDTTARVQNLNYAAAAACTVQSALLHLETITPGCLIDASIYVDRMYGTIIVAPVGAVSAACTEP